MIYIFLTVEWIRTNLMKLNWMNECNKLIKRKDKIVFLSIKWRLDEFSVHARLINFFLDDLIIRSRCIWDLIINKILSSICEAELQCGLSICFWTWQRHTDARIYFISIEIHIQFYIHTFGARIK